MVSPKRHLKGPPITTILGNIAADMDNLILSSFVNKVYKKSILTPSHGLKGWTSETKSA